MDGVSKLDFKVLSLAIFAVSILTISGTAQDASAGASPSFLFEFGTSGSGDGEFDELRGVEVDSSTGNIIVADRDNSRIQVFDSTGGFLFEFDGSVGEGGTFIEPKAVALDGAGNIYVADAEDFEPFGLIQKFDSAGNYLDDFTVDSPRGVAVLSSGNIVVIDAWDQEEIDVYNAAGILQFSFDGTTGGGDLFDKPKGVAVDGSDKIYVADSDNDQIQIFNSAGSFLSKFGSFCKLFGFGSPTAGCVDPDGGGPLELGDGQFNRPNGIAVGSTGIIYVADDNNDRIQLFDSSGSFLAKIGSSGSGDAEFDDLRDVAVDSSGKFYVADEDNNRIQVFDTGTPPVTACEIFASAGIGRGNNNVGQDPDVQGAIGLVGPDINGFSQIGNPTMDGYGMPGLAFDTSGNLFGATATGTEPGMLLQINPLTGDLIEDLGVFTEFGDGEYAGAPVAPGEV